MNDLKPRDVQVAQIGPDTLVLRSRTWDRLKFEIEYSLQRGTTANAYLVQGETIALLDPPGESFRDIFIEELQQHLPWQKLSYLILSHLNANRLNTLKALREWAPHITLVCTKPGAQTLLAALPECQGQVQVVRTGDILDLGRGHRLEFVSAPTPRWPDGLCTFDQGTSILYTDKLFGAHVCGDSVLDEQWKQLDEDRRFYFDCLHAAQTRQVEGVLDKLAALPYRLYAPGHGPMVRFSCSRLTLDYRQWCERQKTSGLKVALFYTSAYGNTAILAQTIARGLTKSEVQVELVNCELGDGSEVAPLLEQCDGFLVGSPTLGGHAPVQVQTTLGIILANASKTKLAGVFGSYGWSGEAVDMIEGKLRDAGFTFGCPSLRVKFSPTEAILQQAEEMGTDFAQALRKSRRVRQARQAVPEAQVDRTNQAMGRIVGALCVVTACRGDAKSAMLASWVSQASFNPPGLTVAVARERAIESFTHGGDKFVLNILQEGRNLRRHFLKPYEPGEDRFVGLETETAANGAYILKDALAYLECTVRDRMECGDHWLVYASVDRGRVLNPAGVTAVHHRKSGSHY